MTQDNETAIADALLAQVRQQDKDVPDGLMRRVLTDAQRVQPMPQRMPEPKRWLPDLSWLQRGSWAAAGGMIAASCVGFWLGVNPPDALLGLSVPGLEVSSTIGAGDSAEMSGFGWDIEGI